MLAAYLSGKKHAMKVLIVVATKGESSGLLPKLGLSARDTRLWQGNWQGHQLDLLHTGIGMVNTALWMGRQIIQSDYELALNLGIAGSFGEHPGIGEVVEVKEDIYAELGADSPAGFLDLEALGFPAWQNGSLPGYNRLSNPHAGRSDLSLVRALTVNRVHGTAGRIAATRQRWEPEIESMEGAAFFQVALEAGLSCTALRSISNYVEPRNRAAWDIPAALRSLEEAALRFLEGM